MINNISVSDIIKMQMFVSVVFIYKMATRTDARFSRSCCTLKRSKTDAVGTKTDETNNEYSPVKIPLFHKNGINDQMASNITFNVEKGELWPDIDVTFNASQNECALIVNDESSYAVSTCPNTVITLMGPSSSKSMAVRIEKKKLSTNVSMLRETVRYQRLTIDELTKRVRLCNNCDECKRKRDEHDYAEQQH